MADTENTQKGSKKRFLIRQNKIGCQFSKKPSFSKLHTIQKQKNHLPFASLILGEGRGHETSALFLPPEFNWQKLSELFVGFCIVCSFEKEDFLEIRILSCFVWIKSVLFNFLCFGIFFQNAGSQLCFRFFFMTESTQLFSAKYY